MEDTSASTIYSVVIDNGSSFMKVGICNDDPQIITIPTIIGRTKNGDPEYCFGDDTKNNPNILKTFSPIHQDLVTNWDLMERIWSHCYNKMQIDSIEHPLIMSDSPLNPKINREKTTQLMFESFCVPAFYLYNQSALSLLSYGQTTGLVIDSGTECTYTVPIYEGHPIRHAIGCRSVGGQTVTDQLSQMLMERGIEVPIEIVSQIKEKTAFVSLEDEETESFESFELPDGKIIELGNERHRCTEHLFIPKTDDEYGIPDLTYNSITKSGMDSRSGIYAYMYLAGGNTMIKGFKERMQRSMVALGPATMRVQVQAPSDRRNSSFWGACITSSLSSFSEKWISKQEYDEVGPDIINRMCF